MIDLDTKLGITLAIVQPIKHAIKKFWKIGRNFLKFGKLEIGPTLVKLLKLFLAAFLGISSCSKRVTSNFGDDVFLCKKCPLAYDNELYYINTISCQECDANGLIFYLESTIIQIRTGVWQTVKQSTYLFRHNQTVIEINFNY
eukprot:TRINITY_DN9191_c1_g1_i7.p2 TRINITY_DN9191_c1_g1~~TRINITY_DN9191_c1_g1_i7.p2  ORF type:complete len:143 (-),score=0.30 TRINITY_DN9191_c1_g1_i7:239-667(-)